MRLLTASMSLLAFIVLCVWSGSALAHRDSTSPRASLSAAFQPKRLGAATSLSFTIGIAPPAEAEIPALTTVDFSYPENLGFATSGLGLAACMPDALEAEGSRACPRNSKMGTGSATAAVAFGSELVYEHVALELFEGPSPDGYVHLVILARGAEPVLAHIVMTGVLMPGHLQIDVPIVAGLPAAPDVSLVRIHATLGGPLMYVERVHGRPVLYRPKGIGLPDSCPRGGWQLGANLDFVDRAKSRSTAVIACPPPNT